MKKITLSLFFICFVSILNAQTFFSDDFSDGDISDWTLYDADGDTYNWEPGDWSFGGALPEFTETVASRSWISGVGGLNPDNYLVSPAIDLTNATAGLQLEYLYGTPQGAPFHQETYSVYVTTSNSLSAIQAATALHTETLPNPASSQSNVINLDAFVGQTVYVSFRHHNTFDMNVLVLDDVVLRVPLTSDAQVNGVSLNRFSLPSTDNQLAVEIYNNGSSAINSVELNWNDGVNDHIQTINTNIMPGQTGNVVHPTPVNFTSPDEKDILVTVLNVNGSLDGDTNNNTSNKLFTTISQSGTPRVLVEQLTGTWCQFCPRGKVGMPFVENTYGDDVMLVAVHGGIQNYPDPMQYTPYISAVSGIIGGGMPNAFINRRFDADPGPTTLETAFLSEFNNRIVPADVNSTATLSGSTLDITASAMFYTNSTIADYRFAVIITEDGVTGTTQFHAQQNAYSGGALGPMGGYENLPNPVPGSQMVYDYVGRELLGGFDGEPNSIPSNLTDGGTVSQTFTYNIPPEYDQNNLNVIVIVIDGVDGSIVGGIKKTLAQVLSVQDNTLINGVSVYPNPVNDVLKINLQEANGNYNVAVFDLLGRQVLNSTFDNITGSNELELPVNSLSAGQYVVKLTNNDNSFATKFIKK